jgi:transcription elongation factor Elf1
VRIAALERRVKAMEDKLADPFRCRMCGKEMSAFKYSGGILKDGAVFEVWLCKECDRSDNRWTKPL